MLISTGKCVIHTSS